MRCGSNNKTIYAMNKISFNEVPKAYVLCAVSDCPMASHCLRQMAMQVLDKSTRLVTIVNPQQTQPSEACGFYRSDEPQVFARGFESMQEEMLPRQYSIFMKRLKSRFGRTGYFERRRGERLCSPSDIAFIKEILSDLSLSHLTFDGFVEQYNW